MSFFIGALVPCFLLGIVVVAPFFLHKSSTFCVYSLVSCPFSPALRTALSNGEPRLALLLIALPLHECRSATREVWVITQPVVAFLILTLALSLRRTMFRP